MNLWDVVDPWKVVSGVSTGFAGLLAWIGIDHVRRDENRFDSVKSDFGTLNAQLDSAKAQMAANHSELLKLFIEQKGEISRAAAQAVLNAAVAQAAAAKAATRVARRKQSRRR